MKFAFKLFFGSACCVLGGIWWLVDGIVDGPMNELLGGMLWKGALLLVAGAVGAVMGFRMMKEIVEDQPQSHNKPLPPSEAAHQERSGPRTS